MLHIRHGQSAARGPHAARQTFFAALEIKGAQFFCKINPKKCHFWIIFWLFKPKNDIFKEHFWCLLGFSLICREIFKKLCTPLPPRMNLRPPEHKNYWKWPATKKVWPPLLYILPISLTNFQFTLRSDCWLYFLKFYPFKLMRDTQWTFLMLKIAQ